MARSPGLATYTRARRFDFETPWGPCDEHACRGSPGTASVSNPATNVDGDGIRRRPGFGIMRLGAARIEARRAAVAAVYESGGGVAYDYQRMPYGRFDEQWAWEPSWLRQAVGDVVFHDVTVVYWLSAGPGGRRVTSSVNDAQTAIVKAFPRLGSVVIIDAPGVTDKTLRHLADVRELSELNLGKIKITDDGLANLKGLKKLRTLALQAVPITDRGLSHLAGLDVEQLMLVDCPINGSGLNTLGSMPRLLALLLRNVGVTDDSLAALRQVRSLRYLTLIATGTTDRGLEHVAAMTWLQHLILGRENSSDEGIRRLKGLINLNTLSLKGPEVTDAAIMDLVTLKGLVRLDLVDSEVTDEGIKALVELPRLQYLDLSGTRTSDEAVDALRASRPGLNVTSARTRPGKGATPK